MGRHQERPSRQDGDDGRSSERASRRCGEQAALHGPAGRPAAAYEPAPLGCARLRERTGLRDCARLRDRARYRDCAWLHRCARLDELAHHHYEQLDRTRRALDARACQPVCDFEGAHPRRRLHVIDACGRARRARRAAFAARRRLGARARLRLRARLDALTSSLLRRGGLQGVGDLGGARRLAAAWALSFGGTA